MGAVDLPARWVVGLTVASAAICFPVAVGVCAAGLRFYERLVGPVRPSAAFGAARAAETTPVPHSPPRSLPS